MRSGGLSEVCGKTDRVKRHLHRKLPKALLSPAPQTPQVPGAISKTLSALHPPSVNRKLAREQRKRSELSSDKFQQPLSPQAYLWGDTVHLTIVLFTESLLFHLGINRGLVTNRFIIWVLSASHQALLDHKFPVDRELIHTVHCCISRTLPLVTPGTEETTSNLWMKNEWAPYILSSGLDVSHLAGPKAWMNSTSSSGIFLEPSLSFRLLSLSSDKIIYHFLPDLFLPTCSSPSEYRPGIQTR